MSWRDSARPVIAKAIEEAKSLGLGDRETRKLISSRYPFGPREMHPYKVWLDEIKRQLECEAKHSATYEQPQTIVPLPGQLSLFDGLADSQP